jgi:uncharacterized protein
MDFFLLLAALVGHAFFWIGLVNRLHAVGIWRWVIKSLTAAFFLLAAALPIAVGIWFYKHGDGRPAAALWSYSTADSVVLKLIAAYVILSWVAAATTLLRFAGFLFLHRTPSLVRYHGSRWAAIDLESAAGDAKENSHHFLAHLPFNEILRLHITDWMLDVPRLAPALDGLSIVHLSDFHLTGYVGKAFFREVVRASNELQPDIVALTGDLMDAAEFIDWIPDTLGQLTARHGVFFVLGNHDRFTRDIPRLRRTLEASGLIDLGGRTRQIEINGQPILLTGNELPWIKEPETASVAETETAGGDLAGSRRPLRIVLSHSPDQLGWARKQDADLMLAGHTHGGQICIPPLGAIFSPSIWGVKHISGIYDVPPTILHVTRGVSGVTPARWFCPPEIARLRLRTAKRHCVTIE